jgi:methylglutamate dehydrogenase subunit D
VPDPALSPRSPLDRVVASGYHGVKHEAPGVVIALRADLALAAIMARKDRTVDLCARVREIHGIDLPLTPRLIAATAADFIWAGPGRWLAATPREAPQTFEAGLRSALSGLASVTGQSDGRSIIHVAGPKARETLAKGLPLDLDSRAFGPNDVTLSVVGHINVHFWQREATPSYEFAVVRSFAASFCGWLMEAAAEFGVAVHDATTPDIAGRGVA